VVAEPPPNAPGTLLNCATASTHGMNVPLRFILRSATLHIYISSLTHRFVFIAYDPTSFLSSAPTQTDRTQQLPSLHNSYNMNATALFNPLLLPDQNSNPFALSDQQQQLALLQQLWGLATNPALGSTFGGNHSNSASGNFTVNGVNPSFVLPASLTTNNNHPLLPGGLHPSLLASAIQGFVPASAFGTSLAHSTAAAPTPLPDWNTLLQQARMIAAPAIQQPPLESTTTSESSDPLPTGRLPCALFISCDDESLSDYQCLVRKQIELFEATVEDVESNAQGRNRPIVLGQVGIRCRHCAMLPPKHRERGAIYYPSKLPGIYQAAQNLAVAHLGTHCRQIPAAIRDQLTQLRERKSSAGGGKQYWADGVRVLGVLEGRDGLRFAKE
jgi:hypothetical protein